MSEMTTRQSGFDVGSASIAPATRGQAAPAGTLHLVKGWQPVCGGDRVRFVFPGRDAGTDATCPACTRAAAASSVVAATPRPRSSTRTATTARTATTRSRARAS